jgi:hypothetical protein
MVYPGNIREFSPGIEGGKGEGRGFLLSSVVVVRNALSEIAKK